MIVVSGPNLGLLMNVSRGLFRTWIFVSTLWLIGVTALAGSVLPNQMASARYQYVYEMRSDVGDPNKVDWKKSIYELMRSASQENLSPTFAEMDWQYWSEWDKGVENGTMQRLQYPHGKLYLSKDLTQADQTYIAKHFIEQQSRRWARMSLPWVGWMLVPPAVLFCVGSALLWVARGFTRAST
jgi:hypothetical protein